METHPTSVTVFPDRARVTRSGRVALAVGLQKIEVDNLPLALIQDSVRAAGKGAARAKLAGVSTRLENFVETPAEAVRELEAKIQAGEDADMELIARGGVLEKEQKYLEGLAAQSEMFARGLALRNRTSEEQGAIFDFISSRSQNLQSELLKISRERRELAKELDRLRRDLRNAQSARPRQRYVVTVELEVSAPGDFELELTYMVTGAGWKPLYDLRLLDGSLDVTYLAQVVQNTGEDWPDVALTLSTAFPALSLVIPELEPWYIRAYAPPRLQPAPKARGVMQAMSPAPASAPQAFAAGAAMQEQAAPLEELMALDVATVSESGASLTFHLAARADIPGNGDPRKVTVATFPLKPDFDYVTAPKLADACYRRAKVKNESAYMLLPGSAQLFEGDDYLGTTTIERTAPGGELELFFGADERVKVERELAAREVDKTFIGDRRRIRFAYTIEVENLRDAPQTVFVRDQLPVSRDEQIKVKLESADPKPLEQSELNLLEWKLQLDKASKRKIRFDFTVEFPRAMEVVGLP